MKIRLYLLFLITTILLYCSNNQNFEEKIKKLKVGMTTEEIELILGKPTEISRGVNEIQDGELKHIGALIYITWYYPENRMDTSVYNYLESVPYLDTTEVYTYTYYLNDQKVTKEVYDKHKKGTSYLYHDKNGKRVSKAYWSSYKRIYPNAPEPELITSKYYKTKTRPKSITKFKNAIYQDKIEYQSVYGVLFDASQGRVTHFGYLPISTKNVVKSFIGYEND